MGLDIPHQLLYGHVLPICEFKLVWEHAWVLAHDPGHGASDRIIDDLLPHLVILVHYIGFHLQVKLLPGFNQRLFSVDFKPAKHVDPAQDGLLGHQDNLVKLLPNLGQDRFRAGVHLLH
jgi:hypothetical protein